MKFVVINGSPRKKNTWAVAKQAMENLDGSFEEIHLAKERIPLCVGCHKCVMYGEDKCPHYDKVHPIIEKIRDADGIIITSPVYAMNVSGLLKNFIDHTAYLYHRAEFYTKKALVIVTTAGTGHKKVAKYMDETLRHWGVNKVYTLKFACGGKDTLDTKTIDKVSGEFGKDVESEKLHSPKFMDVLFFQVWKAMALSDVPIEADAKFWHEKGLVNHDFAPEVNLGIIKKIFAKIVFSVLKRVM